MEDTLAQQGWRMPAEWEPHHATWIAWPHNPEDWPGKFEPIPWVYAQIVRQLHRSEDVCILVADLEEEARARDILARSGVDWQRLHFLPIPTDRVWTRDYCPLFLLSLDGRLGLSNWKFNAWAKYDNWQRDDAVAEQIQAVLERPGWQPSCRGRRVVLEGGSIDVNGQGLLLTTEECLLSPIQQRNPDLGRDDVEQLLANYLGIRKVLWLGQGIAGDDTHGHVDDLARFVGPRTIVTALEQNPGDANYHRLQENLKRLRSMTDLDGHLFEVIPLPMPEPLYFDGQRLPASYANFYIANDRVLVPTFNDPSDRTALGILADLFPGRIVVGIHAVDLVWGFGTLHCLSMQQPKSAAD